MKKFGVLCLLLIIPFFVRAQDVSPSDITNIVTFVVTPETPGPHQGVRVAIEAYGLDLGAANIVWSLNGTTIQSGKGITSIDITTGNIGAHSAVTVSINTGTTAITRSIDIVPGSVDLLYEGNTYAPPFYKGRTLWTHQSRVTLLAIPHIIQEGAELSPRALSYRWTLDGNVLGDSSGVGKNSITFTDSVLSQAKSVTVDIMTDQDTVVGNTSLTLSATDAKVLVYENNPLLGLLFNREVGDTLTLTAPEVTFSAIPLFMSGTDKKAGFLSYQWATNNANAETGDHVTYRTPDSATGSSNVGVTIMNTGTVLQSAEKSFLVQFGQQARSL